MGAQKYIAVYVEGRDSGDVLGWESFVYDKKDFNRKFFEFWRVKLELCAMYGYVDLDGLVAENERCIKELEKIEGRTVDDIDEKDIYFFHAFASII